MASTGSDRILSDLERRRAQLEQQMQEIKKLLKYWQTCELDYESLKEELNELGSNLSVNSLNGLRRGFEGTLIKQKG